MNTVTMISPEREERVVEAPSDELVRLMVAGWTKSPEPTEEVKHVDQ